MSRNADGFYAAIDWDGNYVRYELIEMADGEIWIVRRKGTGEKGGNLPVIPARGVWIINTCFGPSLYETQASVGL